MENNQSIARHSFLLNNREEGTVLGVLDVISFDDKIIVLATQAGKMTIKGNELHIKQLNLEKGQVDLAGKVDTVLYSDENKVPGQKKESILGRMFK